VDARVLAPPVTNSARICAKELYYRLSVFPDRNSAACANIRRYPADRRGHAANLNKNTRRAYRVDAEVMDLFHRYDWPGMCGLRNVLERAAIMQARV